MGSFIGKLLSYCDGDLNTTISSFDKTKPTKNRPRAFCKFEPTVLYFLCGENTAVSSVALTVHWTVIHYHLTLRVIRPSVS